jgi:CheY-like chemotaxis protein
LKILVVEDDPYKFAQVETLICSVLSDVKLAHFNSVHGAVRYLKTETPDKIILDMSLPTHPPMVGEGSPVSLGAGGVEVLLALRRLKQFDLPVAILTQYIDFEIEDGYYALDAASEALRDLYNLNNVIAVLYEHDSVIWAEIIKNFLGEK